MIFFEVLKDLSTKQKVYFEIPKLIPKRPTSPGERVKRVSCERVFSQLKYIKNDHRARMKPDILHSILFLRANWDLVK